MTGAKDVNRLLNKPFLFLTHFFEKIEGDYKIKVEELAREKFSSIPYLKIGQK